MSYSAFPRLPLKALRQNYLDHGSRCLSTAYTYHASSFYSVSRNCHKRSCQIVNRNYHKPSIRGRFLDDFNHDGQVGLSLPAVSAAFFAAMSIWWSNENCSMEPVKGHPSPTPNTVDFSLQYEDFEESELDMNRLPVYTSHDVSKNDGKHGSPIWMSYGGVVYDVTNFIANHPGGSERILLAAGSAIEPFWHTYRQHFATDLPMRIMEELAIGRLAEKDQDAIDEKMEKMMEENEDPYSQEPTRSPLLIVHSDQPMNAEVPAVKLTENYLTPADMFYIRHHHPVPLLKSDELKEFELEVDLSSFGKSLGGIIQSKSSSTTRKFTLDEIKKLPRVEVVATLQCSGNRRGDINKIKRTSGTSWEQGAVSTAKWGGARLIDVLKAAGLDDPYGVADLDGTQKHVRFEALDGMKASINMEKATNPFGDVIVAYEMNGEDLPREHGYPLRVIVPGFAAVRNVKWVHKIELAESESEGAWQRGLNYKTLPPNVTDANSVNLSKMPSMTEASVFSGITKIEGTQGKLKPGEKVKVRARGWAWAGGGRNIVRVDVTGDGGESWSSADIVEGSDQKYGRAWAWIFWECEVSAVVGKDGCVELASKAVDMAFNIQPESPCWNVRGLGNNSWYRKRAKIY